MEAVEIFLIIFGVALLIVIYKVFKGSNDKVVNGKSKEHKQKEIVQEYKRQMNEALKQYQSDKVMMSSKKTEMLKKFSAELSKNIFFDHSEVKEVIRELAHYEIEK